MWHKTCQEMSSHSPISLGFNLPGAVLRAELISRTLLHLPTPPYSSRQDRRYRVESSVIERMNSGDFDNRNRVGLRYLYYPLKPTPPISSCVDSLSISGLSFSPQFSPLQPRILFPRQALTSWHGVRLANRTVTSAVTSG